MKRRFNPAEPEWMDRPQPVSRELMVDLENLRALNRYFGNYALLRHFLRRWLKPNDHWEVVDLATGSGDLARMMVQFAHPLKAKLRIDAVDFQSATLEIARHLSLEFPDIHYHLADIQAFGQPGAYDFVFCSQALHHFSEEEAVELLKHCANLSRRYVLIADLRRSWLGRWGVRGLTTLLFREPMTRNDGRVSMERAFSFEEFEYLARTAGWTDFGHRAFHFSRQAIWLEPVR